MEEFEYEGVVKATECFSSSNLIGRGSHGSVYKASLCKYGSHLVAVKTSHSHQESSFNEVSILSSLPPHPNIVKLLGSTRRPKSTTTSTHDDHHPLLVMEFLPNGSLHDSLHTSPNPPSWDTRFQVVLHVARALECLHGSNPPVIHRDVKSANILFDSEWNAKLADFGLAVRGDDSPSPAGTIGYLDPSYTCPSKLSTKNDIFSFGVLTLEILSGRKAIDVSKEPSSITDWAASFVEKQHITGIPDSRIPLPATLEGDFLHILRVATRCLVPDEVFRPSARELIMELERRPIKEVRTVSWMSPLRSIMLSRQRRKLAKKCRDHGPDVGVDVITRKLSLREVLADIGEQAM